MKLTSAQKGILFKLAAGEGPVFESLLKDSPKSRPYSTLRSLGGRGLVRHDYGPWIRQDLWTITDAGRKVLKEIEISK